MPAIKEGLYTIRIQMGDGSRGRATGVIVLHGGNIGGGDTNFWYIGSYTSNGGKWRGELVTRQHAEAPGVKFLFGGREVGCGFTGTYSDSRTDIHGTALVGKNSVSFAAQLTFVSPI
jgi:hypothetical protein